MSKEIRARLSRIVFFTVLLLLVIEVVVYYFFPLSGFSFPRLADLGPGKIFQDFVFLFDYGKDCETELGSLYLDNECSITPYNLPLWIITLVRALKLSPSEGKALGAALDLSFLLCVYLIYRRIAFVAQREYNSRSDTWWGILMAALMAGYPVRLALERSNLDLLVFILIGISCFAATSVLRGSKFAIGLKNFLRIKEGSKSDHWVFAILIGSLPVGLASMLKLYGFLALFVVSALSTYIVISRLCPVLWPKDIIAESWQERKKALFSLRTSLCLLCLQWTYFALCFGVVQGDLDQISTRIPTTNSGGDLFTGLTADISSSFTSGALETLTIKIVLIAVSFTLFMSASRRWLQASGRESWSYSLDSDLGGKYIAIPLLAVLFGFTASANYILSTPIVYRFIFLIPVITIGCIQLSSCKISSKEKDAIRKCSILIQLSSLVTFWYGYRPYQVENVFIAESFVYTICHPLVIGFSLGVMFQNARYLKRSFLVSSITSSRLPPSSRKSQEA